MSTTTELYLVRHGQTEYNRRGIIQGRDVNSSLNQNGQAEARKLAKRFADASLAAIYTSTLRRAMQTAAFVARNHRGVPVHREPDLEEMSWGIFEGKAPTDDILAKLDSIKEGWKSGRFDETVEGAETVIEVRDRAMRAMDVILERHRGETVLAVTHGRLLRILLASLLNDEYGLKRMDEIPHANTGVNHLVFDGDACRAQVLNCLVHLEVETVNA